MNQEEIEVIEAYQKEHPQEFFCELCGFYPLIPVHGHFECPQCRYKTKCCEGAPQ
jgi:hypothetical protein